MKTETTIQAISRELHEAVKLSGASEDALNVIVEKIETLDYQITEAFSFSKSQDEFGERVIEILGLG